jgi:hypothetical protein
MEKQKKQQYMTLTYFRRRKAFFRCLKQFIWQFKTENNRIGQQVPTAGLV